LAAPAEGTGVAAETCACARPEDESPTSMSLNTIAAESCGLGETPVREIVVESSVAIEVESRAMPVSERAQPLAMLQISATPVTNRLSKTSDVGLTPQLSCERVK
jgi:hypothetical protein